MKTSKVPGSFAALTFLLCLCNAEFSVAFAQGNLAPPGAPAPTMKSLDQIEARTPISSGPYTITQPGSYYLTTNLTVSGGNGITIAANGVTLDLNGFTISSTASTAFGTGIDVSGRTNIAICNGCLRGGVTNAAGTYTGGGFAYGIYYPSGILPANVRVWRVSVTGILVGGIVLGNGDSTAVESCVVRTVGGYGIAASVVKNCAATDCGGAGDAIYGEEVADSRGESTGSGRGVTATATASNCYGISNTGTGVEGLSVHNCNGVSQGGGDGVNAFNALNCYGTSVSGDGVTATTANNCYGTSTSGIGLYAAATAVGCYGASTSGTGLYAYNANACSGYRIGGTAIQAAIANACLPMAGTNSVIYKYNMP